MIFVGDRFEQVNQSAMDSDALENHIIGQRSFFFIWKFGDPAINIPSIPVHQGHHPIQLTALSFT